MHLVLTTHFSSDSPYFECFTAHILRASRPRWWVATILDGTGLKNLVLLLESVIYIWFLYRVKAWVKPHETVGVSWLCSFIFFCCSGGKSCPTLWPHGLQHTRLLSCLLSPRVSSNSCPSCPWCHPTCSCSGTRFSSCLQSFPASGSFSINSAVHIRWPKYWSFSFSISPSSETPRTDVL